MQSNWNAYGQMNTFKAKLKYDFKFGSYSVDPHLEGEAQY